MTRQFFLDIASGLLSMLLGTWILGGFQMQQPDGGGIVLDWDFTVNLAPSLPVQEKNAAVEPVQDPAGGAKIPEIGVLSPARTCTDEARRTGEFQALVFLEDYSWAYGRFDRVELGQVPIVFPAVLDDPRLRQALEGAQEIVAAGTASCEASENIWGHFREEWRAGRRADQLAEWLREKSWNEAPVHQLNLGRFDRECGPGRSQETRNERRIVLITVTRRADGLDLESCLRQSIRSRKDLSFLLDDYSKFDLDEDPRS